jgi:hypothetical protein
VSAGKKEKNVGETFDFTVYKGLHTASHFLESRFHHTRVYFVKYLKLVWVGGKKKREQKPK